MAASITADVKSQTQQGGIASERESVTGRRDKIVEKAKELAIKYRDSNYYSPVSASDKPRDTSNFDCSYFVYLVMKEIFPNYKYLNTPAIRSSPEFKKKDTPQPGDLILFTKSQVPYAVKKGDKREYPNHVGIVLDSSSWVGRQTGNIGIVLFSNPWWGSRDREFYAYCKIDSAIARANGSNLRRHFA